MDETELIEKVASKVNLPKPHIETALHGILDYISEAIANGQEVSLPGFGSFRAGDNVNGPADKPAGSAAIYKSEPIAKIPKNGHANIFSDDYFHPDEELHKYINGTL